MSRAVWFNCASGAAGDMIVASLLDLGADEALVREAVASLDLGPVSLEVAGATKGELAAKAFRVEVPPEALRLPTPADVRRVLAKGKLLPRTVEKCLAVFERLAGAEARAHGMSPEEVHFHELGSADTIVDVVSAVTALEVLGVEKVLVSPVNTGSGKVTTEHGTFPVPAPATANLLRGFQAFSDGEEGEKLTPTGAAILTALGAPASSMPAMTVEGIGYGAGRADFSRSLNVLQVVLGTLREEETRGDASVVMECNVDDLNPQVIPWLMQRLLDEGAQDVFLTPVIMKKGRPGFLVTLLAPPERAARLGEVLMAESSTIGLRHWTTARMKASRELASMDTPWGKVGVKVSRVGGRPRAVPEFEDCRRVAEASGRPLVEIMAELGRLAAARFEKEERD